MKQAPRQRMTAPIRRIRFVYVALFFAFWMCAIGLRLAWLQVWRTKDFVHQAAMQQEKKTEVAPRRGVVYDRNLRELAVTVQVDSVFAVPSELGENRANAAHLLAQIVHAPTDNNYTTQQQMLARFNASRKFAWVARRLDPDVVTRVKELNLKGVYIQREFKRFYPSNDLAAQVLGYVGADDNGLGGLELLFDNEMHGQPGHVLTAVDAKRHALGSRDQSEPVPGENLVLAIDANIQHVAERVLDAQMAKMKAAHGTVVVQDPHTGQILALAISPRFNPNDRRHMDSSSLQNLAVSDPFEPGSTFKLATYAAALDGAGVQPTDMVDCQGGAMTMFGRTLHDDKSDHFGVVTVQFALEHSSDVGAAKMALKLGSEKFYDYAKGFGFGNRTGIELPSETRGVLRAPKKWGSTSILSIAIGHEVMVTPVQLVTMVSTIANGGVYMPPHVLLQSTDQMKGDARLKPMAFRPSNQLPSELPDGAHRVIKEMTSAKMRMMMQGTVVEGTGKLAQLNGYSSGGKTGTAQKFDPVTHKYSHTKLTASFVGFAPVSNPAIAIAVVIDSPTVGTRYGGETSAPVFAQVAQQVLEYLGVPHDQPLKTSKQVQQQMASAKDGFEDGPSENDTDIKALYADINDLPADDPLRSPANTAAANAAEAAAAEVAIGKSGALQTEALKNGGAKTAGANTSGAVFGLLPGKVVAAFRAKESGNGAGDAALLHSAPFAAPRVMGDRSVLLASGRQVAVPAFEGHGLRAVVEEASGAGLRVQPVGSGLAREQVPAAGTMVPSGTEVVVRFSR